MLEGYVRTITVLCTMQDLRLAAVTDVEKTNFDVNVDGLDKRTDVWTEIWTPISHPAISRCDNKYLRNQSWIAK